MRSQRFAAVALTALLTSFQGCTSSPGTPSAAPSVESSAEPSPLAVEAPAAAPTPATGSEESRRAVFSKMASYLAKGGMQAFQDSQKRTGDAAVTPPPVALAGGGANLPPPEPLPGVDDEVEVLVAVAETRTPQELFEAAMKSAVEEDRAKEEHDRLRASGDLPKTRGPAQAER